MEILTALGTINAGDGGRSAQGGDDVVEMFGVGDVDINDDVPKLDRAVGDFQVCDVTAGFRDDCRD